MTSEAQLQTYILKKLRAIPDSFWIKPTVTNYKGCPDILGFIRGYFIAIEIKVPTNKPTELQKHTINKINHNGGVAFVATSWKEVKEKLLERCKDLPLCKILFGSEYA